MLLNTSVFEAHYRPYFASESAFKDCMEALTKDTLPVLRFPPKKEQTLRDLWKREGLNWKTLKWYPYALEWPEGCEKGESLPGAAEGLYYLQNSSSLLPVLALDPRPGETILDACAAPGGKTLFIAERMEKQGTLIANDLSRARRDRMRGIFKVHEYDDFIQIVGRNALAFGGVNKSYFDRILLDAPCSSEKHVLGSPKHLAEWKPGRIRHLKKLQWKLLQSLWKALKLGGTLVYSTCAVNPEENEWLIQRFVEKHGDEVVQRPLSKSLPHKNGRVHPHEFPGMDPMYVAVLHKRL